MLKAATGFFVTIALSSCSPKKSTSVVKSIPTGVLIGSWLNCESYSRGAIIGIKSSALVYTFKDDKTLQMRADYYTDDACHDLFTPGEAEKYLKEMSVLSKTPIPKDVRDAVEELSQPIIEEIPYQATLVPIGEVGAIDFISLQKPSFTSYRIEGNALFIAHVCLEDECETLGDSPTSRAMNLTESDKFVRK